MQTLFGDKYRIIETIGSGGMGTVYLAENVKLGNKWAIKEIPKKIDNNVDFLAEPNILKKLNHPALPRIIDIEQDNDNIYIVEDYIEGKSLDKQLRIKRNFDEATVIDWAKQLCNILLYLHNQEPNPIIYRDMKPSNIIVSDDNVVKVIDFGIAREFKTDSGSDTTYMGTRGYAAPEQYGTSQTDERTDIYSLGVTMYHLLTGKSPNEPPYELKPLRTVSKAFSEGIEFIVGKCVQNDPANRYQNVDELLYDLNNIHIFNSQYKKQKAFETFKQGAKISVAALCFVMIFISGKQILSERTERYNILLETGYENLNLYRFEDAALYFENAAQMNKNSLDAHIGIAQISLKQGDFDKCMSYLDEVEKEILDCSGTPQYNYVRGSVLYEKGDYQNALEYLKKSCETDPSKTVYLRDLAVCYAKLGNLTEAKSILDSIAANSAEDDMLNYIRGQVYAASGNTSDAIASFESVISTTENEDLKTRSYLEISNIYKSMRHSDSDKWSAINNQIAILERASKDLQNEDNLVIVESMAEAYFTAKKYDMSIEKFRKLLDLGYDRAYIYRNIAIIYQQKGNLSSAEDILLNMKEKYPDNYQCYLQLAYVYIEMQGNKPQSSRNYSKALENYNLAVQFAPSGENTSEILQLKAKINELKAKGWL